MLLLGGRSTGTLRWMYSSAKAMLMEMPEVQLGVIVYSYGKKYERYEIDGVTYYLVPTAR